MTSPIAPIAASITGPSIASFTPNVSGPQATGASAADFAAKLGEGIEYVQGLQHKSDDLAVKAATGSLTDAHDYMIASTEATLATQLTVAVRNKAVEAFQEIMRMQG
jgi:flagellar hook-basal body complex protein FliE